MLNVSIVIICWRYKQFCSLTAQPWRCSCDDIFCSILCFSATCDLALVRTCDTVYLKVTVYYNTEFSRVVAVRSLRAQHKREIS